MRSTRRPARAAGAAERARTNATYVYCLFAGAEPPALAGLPAGLRGTGAPRAIPAGRGRWLVAAAAPLRSYSAEKVNAKLSDLEWVGERAMEHERVIEHLARLGTVVPMKLFTLFTSDAKAVDDVAGSRGLSRLLASLDGREEWGLRASVDPARLRRKAREDAQAAAPGLSAGTRFLVQRQREQSAVRGGREDARGRAERVLAALARLAADTRRREPAAIEGATLVLDAAFLVDRARTAEFTEAARRLARVHAAEGLRLVLTGPWPPYNFLEPAPAPKAAR